MKTTNIVLIIVALTIIGLIVYDSYQRNKPTKRLVFSLPKSKSPQQFGTQYWKAFHKLANEVPCIFCRTFAEKFIVFFHDTVNMKLGKPIQDKQNFDYFVNLYYQIHEGQNPFQDQSH